jgi:site-specific DNA-methyltransferase (adenine-specific)
MTEKGNHISAYNGGALKQETYVREFTNYPRPVLEFGVEGKCVHPTQKPVDLLEYLIKTYTDKGQVILDNCMGVASTGIACMKTNRDFIGIELDDTYFETCKNRVNTYIKENNMQDIHIEII